MLNLTKVLYLKLVFFVLISPYQSNAVSSSKYFKEPSYNNLKIVNPGSYIFEIENLFEIVANPGNRDIRTLGAGSASNGNVVAIFDRGDKINVPFTVSGDQPAKYIIRTRVRSGNVNAASSYWPNGYLFSLDGNPITLTGDPFSLSTLTGDLGGSYWGDMVSDTIISTERNHNIEITANSNWTAVDYIEVVVLSGSTNPPVDEPPTANAGNDIEITLPTNSVTLNGSGSDPDSGIISFLWSQLSGPSNAIIQDSLSINPKINSLIEGTYTFNLRVTDDENNEANDQVTVTVNGAITVDELPIVEAGNDIEITLPIDSVTLMGSGSDPDGGAVTYLWTKQSDPSATIQTASSSNTKVNNLLEGIYTFNLKVTDDEGNEVNDQVTVTVNPVENTGGGTPTTATSTLYEAEDNYEIVSDPGSRDIRRFGAGTASNGNVVAIFDRGDEIKMPFTVSGEQPVKYMIKVRVRSGAANSSSSYWPNGYLFDLDGETVTLTGDPSSLSGFTGNLGGSYWGDMVSDTLLSMTENHYIAVRANSNWTAVDYVEVIVFSGSTTAPIDELPIVEAGNDIEITLPTDSIMLMGSGSDPDGGVVTYQWIQLSGPSTVSIQDSLVAKAKVSDFLEGSYTFNLKVTDDEGNAVNDQVTVTVRGTITVDELPIVEAGNDIEITLPTDSVTLMGSGSDPDGGVVTYLWSKQSGPAVTIQTADTSITKISNLIEGIYTFNLKVTDDEGNAVNDQVTVTVNPEENTGGGTPTTVTSTLYEAEDNYEIVADPGSRDIRRFGAGTASNGNIVAIFDRGDEIRIPFKVDGKQPAKYMVKVRVRSGTVNSSSSYWPNGYLFDIDGESVTLTGDPSSLSGFTGNLGGSYWGDMVSDTLLSMTENHYIAVRANSNWTAVDYVEVIVFSGSNTTPVDELPIANAGNDIEITLPTDSVTLMGSGSDPDGGAVTYLWNQESGPFAFIQSEDSASTKINSLVEGVYTFKLKVTDDEGNETNDQVVVRVKEGESSCNGIIVLESQADVNNFNCKNINGSLFIGVPSGSNITDLSNLNTLTSISGALIILGTDLKDLNGLVSLTTVGGGVKISNNDALESISGLQNIRNINGISIDNNKVLTSINNFPNVTEVQNLNIVNNDQLTSLNGVQSLSIIYQFLEISGNASLTNISDLSNVISLTGNDLDIEIINNTLLESCCFSSELISNAGGTVTIARNAEGCNNEEEISITCASEPFVQMIIPGLENKVIIDLKWGDMDNNGTDDIVLIEQIEKNEEDGLYTYEFAIYELENDSYIKVENSATTFDVSFVSQFGLDFLIDYNQDGLLDIVYTENFIGFGYDLKVLLSNQNGSYKDSLLTKEFGTQEQLDFIDADRDGDIDLTLTHFEEVGSRFIYLRNDLYKSYSINPAPRVTDLRTVFENFADYNGDGDLDVMIDSDNYSGNENIKDGVFIFKNKTQGVFERVLDIEGYSLNGSWQDIDLDGDYDVLASTFDFSTVRNYENLGNDTFIETSKEIAEAGGYDFNHDGIADKLVSTFPSYILKKGDSNGNLSDFLTLPERVKVGWADFDRDGDLDIYTSDGQVFVNTVKATKVDQAPSIPSNLNTVTAGNSVTFSWDKPTDDITNQNALTYNIEVKKGNELFTNAKADIVPKFTLNGLEEGTYYWKVKAMDKGLNASNYSLEQSFEISYDSAACLISSVDLGEPYECSSGTYSREITISFTDNPNGRIIVNNNLYEVTSNPLKVRLNDIPANGEAVDLSISFENDNSCSYFQEAAFVSPNGCNCYSRAFLTTQAEVDNFDCTNNTGGIVISGDDITNLNGLSKLISIQGKLEVRDNPKLASLEGLEALTIVNSIYIVNNDILTDISALQTVENINGSLIVNNNPQLSDCCIIEDLISKTSGTVSISGNAAGCSSTIDISNTCNETLYSERIEVEDNYSVLNDPGNFTLRDENNAAFSGRGTLLMWDKLDQARVMFNIPENGNYRLKVHLRSGDASSSSNYFKTYTFFINGNETTFTGNNSTIVYYPSQYGNSYFGTTESPVINLTAGTHTLDILTRAPWSIIDYVEVEEVDGSSSRFTSQLINDQIEAEIKEEFIIYPNPSNGQFSISFKPEDSPKELYLNIMDVTGKSVYQKYYNDSISENIDLSHFPKGIFIVTVKSEFGINKKKIVLK